MNLHPAIVTVRDVVTGDYRTAAVFQKYGLDFCCGGGATIERACQKRGIEAGPLMAELEQVLITAGSAEPRVTLWEADFLADYIVQNHHAYVRSTLPSILQHSEKAARVHGTARPELVEIATIFAGVAGDLESHMMKEEEILFPYIRALASAARNEAPIPAAPFGTVGNPIRMMEAEHEQAGDEMKAIRELSSDYALPSDACMTYRVLFYELEEFERDLHRHVHLENNVLFPKATALEEQGGGGPSGMCMIA